MDLSTILVGALSTVLTALGVFLSIYFHKQNKDTTALVNASVLLIVNTIKSLMDKQLTADELAVLITNLTMLLSEMQKLTQTKLTPATFQLVVDAYSTFASAQIRVQVLRAQQA